MVPKTLSLPPKDTEQLCLCLCQATFVSVILNVRPFCPVQLEQGVTSVMRCAEVRQHEQSSQFFLVEGKGLRDKSTPPLYCYILLCIFVSTNGHLPLM